MGGRRRFRRARLLPPLSIGALLNDFILELADRGLFRPLWSKDVLFELAKNLVKNGEDPELVEKRVGTMENCFADAMVTG